MRKVLGILLYIAAGFFVYMVCVLAFINEPPPIPKLGIIAVVTILAALFLCSGLALNRFQNWRRDSAIVLLAGAGSTAFIVFTFLCILMTDEFKRMMKPDTLRFFSAYITGCCFIVGTGALGVALLKTGTKKAEPSNPPDSEPVARSPQG